MNEITGRKKLQSPGLSYAGYATACSLPARAAQFKNRGTRWLVRGSLQISDCRYHFLSEVAQVFRGLLPAHARPSRHQVELVGCSIGVYLA